ncbi:MAG: signal peptidase II [Aquificae bacterium]|nr:signal peptidase II [Aquificota bacterium]
MGKKLYRQAGIFLTTATAVVILDLLTKELAEEYLLREVRLLPFLELYLIYNKGAAFGLLSDLPDSLRVPLLLLTPVVGFFLAFWYALRSPGKFSALSMGLIGGGALGNLYDRAVLGKVRDFVHLHIGEYYWPAFNLADASITIGVFLFLGEYLLREGPLKDLVNRTR